MRGSRLPVDESREASSTAMDATGSYLTLGPGALVYDRLGTRVGTVERVLRHDDERFDGLVVATESGLRFVDAHEVRQIAGPDFVLEVTRRDVEDGEIQRPDASRLRHAGLRRMLGWPIRMPGPRSGRTDASEEDHLAVVVRLKAAFVADRITTDQLAELVGQAHGATSLSTLEDLLRRAGI